MKELIFMRQNDLPKNTRQVDSASGIQNQVDLDWERKVKRSDTNFIISSICMLKKCLVNTH